MWLFVLLIVLSTSFSLSSSLSQLLANKDNIMNNGNNEFGD